MNMFKRNKRDKEYVLGAPLNNATAFSKASRGLTRRKKKQEVEEEPVLDLSTALPEANEFRTSLLMPNLSARFSMLREQDDPNTKVGKASDDSVLFPKRVSRLNLFQSNYLMDIAEVESIKSSFKPPFADNRQSTASDGYASDDGASSVMARSRPGEGNSLFGGRQKMYMIASGSMRDLPHGMVGAKHIYDHDVAPSAFQRYRREQHGMRDSCVSTQRTSLPTTDADDTDGARSPSTAFSKNRGTQSSTNSGPSNRRTSTAATSIVLDSPVHRNGSNSAVPKIKERDVHSPNETISFATSPNTRRVRDASERPSPIRLSGSRSAVNLRDSNTPASPTPASRATTSNVTEGLAALDFGLDSVDSRSIYIASATRARSPPAVSDLGTINALASEIQPKDRGKATALGLFHKPAQQYDDRLFEERQIRVHEGRGSSPIADASTTTRTSTESQVPEQSHGSSSQTSPNSPPQGDDFPNIPPIPSQSPSPILGNRASGDSMGQRPLSASRTRSKSSASAKEANVKARVESLIRRQNAELAAMEAQHLHNTRSFVEVKPPSPRLEARKSVTSLCPENDVPPDKVKQLQLPTPSADPETRPPLSDVHPALRDGATSFSPAVPEAESGEPATMVCDPNSSKLALSTENQSPLEPDLCAPFGDSVTPATQGLGLSGLVRTHLRQDSDKSSMYPPPSPALPPISQSESQFSMASLPRSVDDVGGTSTELEHGQLKVEAPFVLDQPPTPMTLMSQRAQQLLGLATAIRDANKTEVSQQSSATEHASHQRNESTETQREMQRFDEELAKRREKIEEKLQSVQESSRPRSPSAGLEGGASGSRPRVSGRSNIDGVQSSKTMKMFGLSRDQTPSQGSETWQDQDRVRMTSSRQGSRPPTAQDYDRYGRVTPAQARSYSRNDNNEYDRSQSRSATRSATPSSRLGHRDRSISAADRSQSRTRPYGNDLVAPAMPGGFPISPNPQMSPYTEYDHQPESPFGNQHYERSTSSAAGQYRERNHYFESRAAPRGDNHVAWRHLQGGANDGSSSTGSVPMSAHARGPGSPGAVPWADGRSTPTANGRTTPSGNRKRSVAKGMISEPTFLSSTSSVPLVYLPRNGGPSLETSFTPPIPSMNPRRRGTGGESSLSPRLGGGTLPTINSPTTAEFGADVQAGELPPRVRHRLRKSSSEGGNMAAKARAQALIAEIEREKHTTPTGPMFPNRSATDLGAQYPRMF